MPVDTNTIHIQPSERTLRVWSDELIRVAETQADIGDLRLASDLCDARWADDRIPGVLRTRVQSLFGLVPTFEASGRGDGRRRASVVNALEANEDWWDLVPSDEASLVVTWGILLGVGLGENRWWEAKGSRRVARRRRGRNVSQLAWWHSRYLRLDTLTDRWIVRTREGDVYLDEEPGRWVLYTPYGKQRPWSRGLWRGLAPWWNTKRDARDDWARHSEKGAQLFIEGSEESTREQRQEVGRDLNQRGADSTTVLPFGYKANLLEAKADTTKMYQAQVSSADMATGVSTLGHNLTSEVTGGSHAAATVGQDIKLELREFDGDTWTDCSHYQIVGPWAEHNWGDAELAPWPVYPTKPKQDIKTKADGQLAVIAAAAAAQALEPRTDVAAMLEEAEIPLLAVAPPELVRKPPPAPAVPPAGGAQDTP